MAENRLYTDIASLRSKYWQERANTLEREVARLNESNASMKLDIGKYLDLMTRAQKSWWRRVLLWLLMR